MTEQTETAGNGTTDSLESTASDKPCEGGANDTAQDKAVLTLPEGTPAIGYFQEVNGTKVFVGKTDDGRWSLSMENMTREHERFQVFLTPAVMDVLMGLAILVGQTVNGEKKEVTE